METSRCLSPTSPDPGSDVHLRALIVLSSYGAMKKSISATSVLRNRRGKSSHFLGYIRKILGTCSRTKILLCWPGRGDPTHAV